MPTSNRHFVWSSANKIRVSVFSLASTCLLPGLLSCVIADFARAQDAPRRSRSGALALKVGTIHPVSGPAIENGVIVIRGGRIFNVGKLGSVRIPRRARVLEFPDAHVYPGLVDAMSTAFTSRQSNSNRSTNAGSDFHDELDPTHKSSRELIRHGITTAFVGNRSVVTWRGRGAIVRPNAEGYSLLQGNPHGGTSLRMTTGFGADHALDRLKRFDKTGDVFDSLEAYEKKQADYKKALADYDKKRTAYLAHFKKDKPKTPAKATTEKSTEAAKPKTPGSTPQPGASGRPTGSRNRPTGNRGSRRGGSVRRPTRGSRDPNTQGRRSRRPSSADPATKSKDGKAPAKPKYPKKVKQDPAKEALLQVVKGDLPLRVEVHRQDEIAAALFMAFAKELPGITLEFATEAGSMAQDIAESGASVIVTDLLPGTDAYTRERDGSLPATLHQAGVPVAIGSGHLGKARNLTLMAAYAVGRGLPEDAAVRALTLTPAKILGIADQVGSIEKNKLADLLITSGPLLRSDTRVLRVFSQGETKYEAK